MLILKVLGYFLLWGTGRMGFTVRALSCPVVNPELSSEGVYNMTL